MTYMFRREALLKLGLFDNRPVSQEYMLMLRAIEGNLKIGYLARALSVQIVHSGERISFGANKIEGEKRLLQEKMRYRHLLTRAQVREMQCRFRCVACFVALKRHEYPRAIGYGLPGRVPHARERGQAVSREVPHAPRKDVNCSLGAIRAPIPENPITKMRCALWNRTRKSWASA